MSLTRRLIARLDVKPPKLVKGIQLEGFRVMGEPRAFAERYYADGIDEIQYQDVVASLYGRNSLADLVRETCAKVFVPVCVGGGVRTVDDIRALVNAGAEKVVINTAAVARPELIGEAARAFGCQAVCVAIEYIGTECFTDCGREHTNKSVSDWARRAVDYGAGELLLTSGERDGRGAGMDLDTIAAISAMVRVPVIAHGGAGNPEHIVEAFLAGADGVAVGSILHYNRFTVQQIKQHAASRGIEMRL